MACNEGTVVRCAENGHLYECVKLLRRCRCGTIWFAVRPEPRAEVVLKLVDKAALEAQSAEDEAKGTVSYDSPDADMATLEFLNFHGDDHVIRMADRCFATETHLVAVLEFMPGGDLLELVARHRRFDEPTSRFFFLQMVKGLRYMHDLRIAHMDVSLENMVLSRDHRVLKFIDFGLSCRVSRAEGEEVASARGARGKLFYVAPEVFADGFFKPCVADMWSLGIVLFIMLTGAPPLDQGPTEKDPRFPFIRDSSIGVILKAWNLDRDIGASLLDLLTGLLCVEPAKRLTLDQVEAHPWVGLRKAAASKQAAVVVGASEGGAMAAAVGSGAGSGEMSVEQALDSLGAMDDDMLADVDLDLLGMPDVDMEA